MGIAKQNKQKRERKTLRWGLRTERIVAWLRLRTPDANWLNSRMMALRCSTDSAGMRSRCEVKRNLRLANSVVRLPTRSRSLSGSDAMGTLSSFQFEPAGSTHISAIHLFRRSSCAAHQPPKWAPTDMSGCTTAATNLDTRAMLDCAMGVMLDVILEPTGSAKMRAMMLAAKNCVTYASPPLTPLACSRSIHSAQRSRRGAFSMDWREKRLSSRPPVMSSSCFWLEANCVASATSFGSYSRSRST
jgi:hypothetical protein